MDTAAGNDVPECDLVMKGGITSGIVYPRAIARLAAHYRLRSIGGASAGAIAAAAAAAAEYGREEGGFERLARLPDALAETDDGTDQGTTRLFRLFQPQPATRSLYALLVAGLMPEKPRWGLAAWRWLAAAIRVFRSLPVARWCSRSSCSASCSRAPGGRSAAAHRGPPDSPACSSARWCSCSRWPR